MKTDDAVATLEHELSAFPARGASEDLYEHLLTIAEKLVRSGRGDLVEALRSWLLARTEPRTMIATTLVQKLGLSELRPELEQLRNEIIDGRAFRPYYVRWVDEALKEMP